jgi:hypothetical protein
MLTVLCQVAQKVAGWLVLVFRSTAIYNLQHAAAAALHFAAA